MTRYSLQALVVSTGLLMIGCVGSGTEFSGRAPEKAAVAVIQPSAAATTQPATAKIRGTIKFTQTAEGVRLVADISGLAPNTKHGFHIHEKGDLTDPDLKTAGKHYNPTSQPHAGPDDASHHCGDLGNLAADGKGNAHLEITLKDISVGGANDVVGRSVMIHANEDDFKTQDSGNSGARIAGGVIH